MKDSNYVEYFTEGMVAVIRLNRPEAMNSMNIEMRSQIANAQKQAESDDNVRVVVITGSGRAFSSGTCLKEADDAVKLEGEDFDISITDYKPLVDAIVQSNKVYLAAVNAYAGGVALNFVMSADVAIMADCAVMSSPFANVGLIPDGGACWFMLNSMGYKRAFEAIAECTMLDAQTCLDLGMVNKVVPSDELYDSAMQWAKALSERAPLSLSYTKKILHSAASMTLQDTARLESEYQTKCLRSLDSTKAIKAFLKKEKPTFIGK